MSLSFADDIKLTKVQVSSGDNQLVDFSFSASADSAKTFSWPLPTLKALMQKFGLPAQLIVLVLCGFVLLLSSVTTQYELFYSSYAQLMLGKLALVSSMLLLAAWHKLRLTPALNTLQAA